MLVSLIDAFSASLCLTLPLRLLACQPARSKLYTLSHRTDVCLKQFDMQTHRNTPLKWLHVVCFGISVSKIAYLLVSQDSWHPTCVCLSASGHSHGPVGVWSYSDTCAWLSTDTHTLISCCFPSLSVSPKSQSECIWSAVMLLLGKINHTFDQSDLGEMAQGGRM